MRHSGWDLAALVFVLAIVYVLVRPRSKGAELLEGFFDMLIAMTRQATDLAST